MTQPGAPQPPPAAPARLQPRLLLGRQVGRRLTPAQARGEGPVEAAVQVGGTALTPGGRRGRGGQSGALHVRACVQHIIPACACACVCVRVCAGVGILSLCSYTQAAHKASHNLSQAVCRGQFSHVPPFTIPPSPLVLVDLESELNTPPTHLGLECTFPPPHPPTHQLRSHSSSLTTPCSS